MMLETLGITMTTGIIAGVILSLPPVFSSIFEVLILKEHSSNLKKFFLALGVVGVIYIAVNTNSSAGKDTPLGILCLVGKERLYGFHIIGLILIVARMVGVSWITIRDAKRKAAK